MVSRLSGYSILTVGSSCLSFYFSLNYLTQIRSTVILAVASGLCTWAEAVAITGDSGDADQADRWVMNWQVEFNGADLEPSHADWHYHTGGGGFGNNEKQFYTDRRTENARIEDGNLVIEARLEDYQSSRFTSAKLTTQGIRAWKYGRFEIRAKLPEGRGTWPAFWLMPLHKTHHETLWPHNGEIDIMEHVGYDPNVIHGTVHTEAYNHMRGNHRTGKIEIPAATRDFHVYAFEWHPDHMEWFVDEESFFRLERQSDDWRDWPFNHSMYLKINLAVGGFWGGAEGVDEDAFPQQLIIDYVRVYQLKTESKTDTN